MTDLLFFVLFLIFYLTARSICYYLRAFSLDLSPSSYTRATSDPGAVTKQAHLSPPSPTTVGAFVLIARRNCGRFLLSHDSHRIVSISGQIDSCIRVICMICEI